MISEKTLLLESLRCEDGKFPLLHLHQQRMIQAYAFLWPQRNAPDLAIHLKQFPIPPNGLFKCRLEYGPFLAAPTYVPYAFKLPKTLRCVVNNSIEYALKWADRSKLVELYQQKGHCDDVLIVKNGLITDTTYANIAFCKNGNWYTPALPLLEGTRRRLLLELGIIRCADIRLDDLARYTHFKVFNAMIGWDDCPPMPISGIE